MTEGAEKMPFLLTPIDIQPVEGCWKIEASYGLFAAEDVDLDISMKLRGRANTTISDKSTIVVIASADVSVSPGADGTADLGLPDVVLQVRAAFAVVADLSPEAEAGVKIEEGLASEARRRALRVAYPYLRQEISRNFLLSGYPPPELPLTYDEYGEQAKDTEK